ncbi:MAG: hypothetical protein JWM75_2962 [Sphingomonas bacterium]|jgi:sodium/bile acid cotransporter 7|nr:hypothetical protein [Sphingomonas bacterium]
MSPRLRRLVPDPFIVILFASVALASLAPARGVFSQIVDGAATAAIVLLFFLHGVRLSWQAVTDGVTHWRLHLTILAATFILFPLIGLALAKAFPGLLPSPLWIGILFLCALPSTVQSSIAFTSIGGGNVAGAVVAATASNLLGIALTPLLIGALTEAHGSSVSFAGVWKIVLELLLPFLAGHLMRPWLLGWVMRHKPLLALSDRGTIILAVYSAFSAAVLGGIWSQVSVQTLLVLFGLCALVLTVVLLATRYGARLLGFSREDEVAIVFCGSKKTLASGVPMARVLFAGPDMGAVVLPLMIFHQMQLMVCAWLARRYAATQAPAPTPSEPIQQGA